MNPIKLLAVSLLISGFASTGFCTETKTIAYPTVDSPSFEITVPATWELTPAEEPDGFFHLESPTGALFSFRTIEGTNESLKAAVEESIEEISKQFDDVKLGDAEDWTPNGLSGFYATGEGKDKEGKAVRIGMGWCVLTNGKIVDLWFVSDLSDEKGMNQASEIANSLKAP